MVIATTCRQDDRATICRKHVSRNGTNCLKKNELKPWKVKCWVIPPEQNAEFVANMENVLDIYKRPYPEEYPNYKQNQR